MTTNLALRTCYIHSCSLCFFFNDTATTEIYTLSLHDALPICQKVILFLTVLALLGATAGVLAHAKSSQKLGAPGVKTGPLAGSRNLAVLLPADLPGYKSEARVQAEEVTNMLPQDT